MPAARRPVVSQIRPAQSHGQFSDLLNQRHFGLIHGLGLAHAYRRRIRTKKGFYKALSTFNYSSAGCHLRLHGLAAAGFIEQWVSSAFLLFIGAAAVVLTFGDKSMANAKCFQMLNAQ